MAYRRRELWLLLLLGVGLGVGLAVREFRAGYPDLADRLERLDAEEPAPTAGAPSPVSHRPTRPARTETAPRAEDGAAAGTGPLDLNRATTEQLQRLPGIGPVLAAQILRARERQGGFASVDDLRAVPGIGPKKLQAIRDLVSTTERRPADGAPTETRAGEPQLTPRLE